jgi:multidrug resistance efflux pump
MIVFLTLCYVVLLAILVKVGLIKLNTFWKISPLLWMTLLLIVLFIPMQWGAPAGDVQMYQTAVEIVPNVSGEVVEVPVKPLVPLKSGDVLFKIDPVPYQAAVGQLEASLTLSRQRLDQSERLARRGAGSQYDVERYQAEIDGLQAQLDNARWNLDNTVVQAPSDGWVIGLSLKPGQRVANLPLRSWVSFVMQEGRLVVWIDQIFLRHVRVGQPAEVVLKMFPGRTLNATVEAIAPMIGQGQLPASGIAPSKPAQAPPGAYGVVLSLDDLSVLEDLALDMIPGGAVGTGAIYTSSVKATHVIRRVMVRMEAWMNYVNPY